MKNTEKVIHENVIPSKDLPMRFDVYTAKGDCIPMHWHKSLEVIYIISGSMEVIVNDRHFLLLPDDFIIINSGQIHATTGAENSKIFLIQLPFSFLAEHIPDFEHVRFEDYHSPFSFPGENVLSPIFQEMTQLFDSQRLHDKLRLTSLLYALLSEMTEKFMLHISADSKAKNDKNLERLSLIMDYVEEHYREVISLCDAAALLHLEEAYFCRFFKKNMGQTFLEYVNSIRLTHFYTQLISTNDSIMKLLEDNGFVNYKLFMRLFKDSYGMTPLAKRKEMQKA